MLLDAIITAVTAFLAHHSPTPEQVAKAFSDAAADIRNGKGVAQALRDALADLSTPPSA